MRRSGPLKRRTGLKRRRKPRPTEGPLAPFEWKRGAFFAAGGRCAVCGKWAGWWDGGPPTPPGRGEAHHVLPARFLRSHGLHDRVWDSRNVMWCCARCHELHENGSRLFPASLIPESARKFAAEVGPAAASRLERGYLPDRKEAR